MISCASIFNPERYDDETHATQLHHAGCGRYPFVPRKAFAAFPERPITVIVPYALAAPATSPSALPESDERSSVSRW